MPKGAHERFYLTSSSLAPIAIWRACLPVLRLEKVASWTLLQHHCPRRRAPWGGRPPLGGLCTRGAQSTLCVPPGSQVGPALPETWVPTACRPGPAPVRASPQRPWVPAVRTGPRTHLTAWKSVFHGVEASLTVARLSGMAAAFIPASACVMFITYMVTRGHRQTCAASMWAVCSADQGRAARSYGSSARDLSMELRLQVCVGMFDVCVSSLVQVSDSET